MDLPLNNAENLRTWILSTLFCPQKHFAVVRHAPVGKLIDTDFNDIDLSDTAIQLIGRFIGHANLHAQMTLGDFFDGLKAACDPKSPMPPESLNALEALVSLLHKDEQAWDELRSLWRFISQENLPGIYQMRTCPLIDASCSLKKAPRYKLVITCFQYIDVYDEETGEDLCCPNTMDDTLYTDSLDMAVDQIKPACQRAIDQMIQQRWSATGFVKWAQIYQGDKIIFSVQYNPPGDCQAINAGGIDTYSLDFKGFHIINSDERLRSAIRKSFGQSTLDLASEGNFARDLGL